MNSTTANLVVGLAALTVGLVVTGVRLSRRRRAAPLPEQAAAAEIGRRTSERSLDEKGARGDQRDPEAWAGAPQEKSLYEYLFWTVALAVPFWLFGGSRLPLPVNLPVSALVTFVPATAAAIVSYRHLGAGGVRALLRKAVDFRRVADKRWYLPALFLMPLIAILSYAVMRLSGRPLPAQVELSLTMALVFSVLFLISDMGEELGWTGFALEPMQQRWGAFRTSLLLGVIWVIWHLVPWIQTGNPISWIFWQGLFSVAQRVLIVWVYNGSSRSVFAATLVHVTANLSWALFPNASSHYDPLVNAAVTWLAVLAVLLVWEPATLSRLRRRDSNS